MLTQVHIPQSLSLVTGPAAEPLSTAEAKEHLRVPVDVVEDDAYIAGLITSARAHVERMTQRALIDQTWTLKLDRFPCVIELRRCPVSSAVLTYLDADGALQTLPTSVYKLSENREPATITLKSGQAWPGTYYESDAVVVTFVAGYGADGASVPADALHAMKLLIAHWYRMREAVSPEREPKTVPLGFRALIDQLSWTA